MNLLHLCGSDVGEEVDDEGDYSPSTDDGSEDRHGSSLMTAKLSKTVKARQIKTVARRRMKGPGHLG